jgi:hypothetical protein
MNMSDERRCGSVSWSWGLFIMFQVLLVGVVGGGGEALGGIGSGTVSVESVTIASKEH